MNEFEEIRMQVLVQNVTNAQIKMPIEQMVKTMASLNQAKVQLVYVDNCCQSRSFLEYVFPSVTIRLAQNPLLELPEGNVVYIDNQIAAETHAAHIAAHLEQRLKDNTPIAMGLDCEWDYSTTGATRGKVGKIALLQVAVPDGMKLCSPNDIFLIHYLISH
jgi:hypothetical protein